IAKLALKEGLTVLNEDKIIIRKEKGLFKIYGTPWNGKNQKTINNFSYINEIFFLKKSKTNQIEPIGKTKAVIEFVKNSFYLSVNNSMIKKRFDVCFDLAENLNCYCFGFRPDKSIWRFLNGFLKQSS
ncbi:unnamed protein product, partial [marine sediment metagenome]